MSAVASIGRRRAVELLLAVAPAVLLGLLLARLGQADDQLKVLLLAVAAIGVVAAALHPLFALALLLALAPFEFQFTVGGVASGTNEVLVGGLSIVLAWHLRAADVPRWALLGVVALVAGSWLSLLVARDVGSAAEGALRWTAIAVVFAAAFTLTRRRADPVRTVIDVVAATAVVVTLFALAQRAGISAVVGPPNQAGRVDSSFGYYTNYAGFMAIAAVLVIGEVLHAWGAGRAGRALAVGLTLPVILIGVGVSLSRGGLLCLGAAAAVLLVLCLPRGTLLLRAAVVVGVFVAAGFIATPHDTRATFAERFSRPLGAEFSDRTRAVLQESGREAAVEHPLGIGFRNFAEFLRREVRNRYVREDFFHAHQLPTQIALESGWLGLAGFLTLALTPFALAARALVTRVGTVRGLSFVAATGGLLAQGFFDYLFYEISFLVFFAMLVWGAWYELAGPGARATTASSTKRSISAR